MSHIVSLLIFSGEIPLGGHQLPVIISKPSNFTAIKINFHSLHANITSLKASSLEGGILKDQEVSGGIKKCTSWLQPYIELDKKIMSMQG